MPVQMSEDELYKEAKKRVEEKKGFFESKFLTFG